MLSIHPPSADNLPDSYSNVVCRGYVHEREGVAAIARQTVIRLLNNHQVLGVDEVANVFLAERWPHFFGQLIPMSHAVHIKPHPMKNPLRCETLNVNRHFGQK